MIAILGSARYAAACSICDDPLPLLATARRADLIAVALRVGDAKTTDAGQRFVKYAPFEVRQVLKGTPPTSQILVATQYGMCDYGVDVEPMRPSVLFLEAHGGQYETVRGGCAVRSLPVVNGKAVLRDISVSVDTLGIELGLLPAPVAVKSGSSRWLVVSLFCFLGAMSLAAGFWLGRRSSH